MIEQVLILCIIILCLYLFIQIVNVCSLLYFDEDRPDIRIKEDKLPEISILVAARNEQANIIRCLKALHKLQYPKRKLQILIGNDQSEDKTYKLVADFIKDKKHFELVDIRQTMGKARGKANVLAHLAHRASGEVYLITDADVTVNPQWANELVQYFSDPEIGIVSGLTIVKDAGLTGRMQEIDWMYFMGILKSFSNIGLHSTAVGNNMAVSKKAYREVGGYETLDFSVTEDYKLYKEVRKAGYKTKNILNERSINRSSAIKRFAHLMHQRKRWLIGARELPFYWWIFFGIFGLFTPAIFILMIYNLKLALIFYGTKLALQSISIYILQEKMHIRKNVDYLITYEMYSIFITLSTQIFYILPFRMQWKKRAYSR